MKRYLLLVVALLLGLSGYADERGVEVLQRIGRRYATLDSYSLTLNVMLPDGSKSEGVLSVSGNRLYMKLADNEIFVEDSVRYEVHPRQREIVIDRADAYDKESFNPLKGVDGLTTSYNADYVEEERSLRLTPKSGNGDTLRIYVGVDGESVERVAIGSGANSVTIVVGQARYTKQQPTSFDKARYAGYEVIDFR